MILIENRLIEKDDISRKEAERLILDIKKSFSRELGEYKNYISDSLVGDIYDEIEASAKIPIIGRMRKAYLRDYFDSAAKFEFIDGNPNDKEIYSIKLKNSGVTPLHIYAVSAQKNNEIEYVLKHAKSVTPDMKAKGWKENTPAHILALTFSGDRRQITSDIISKIAGCYKTKNYDGEVPVTLYVKRIIGDTATLGELSNVEVARYLENIARMPMAQNTEIKYRDKEYKLSSFCNDYLELLKIASGGYERDEHKLSKRETQLNDVMSQVSSVIEKAYNDIRGYIAYGYMKHKRGKTADRESNINSFFQKLVDVTSKQANAIEDYYDDISKGKSVSRPRMLAFFDDFLNFKETGLTSAASDKVEDIYYLFDIFDDEAKKVSESEILSATKKLLLENAGNYKKFTYFMDSVNADELINLMTTKCRAVKYAKEKLADMHKNFENFLPKKAEMTTVINFMKGNDKFYHFVDKVDEIPEYRIILRILLYIMNKYGVDFDRIFPFIIQMKEERVRNEVIEFVAPLLRRRDFIIYDEINIYERFYENFLK